MTGEELAKQIEESDLTEEELEKEGWGRVCGNLPADLADTMKKQNTSRVKIPDDLNPGTWLILECGYKSYIPEGGEYDVGTEKEDAGESPESGVDNEVQSVEARQDPGQVQNKQDNLPADGQSWFDL